MIGYGVPICIFAVRSINTDRAVKGRLSAGRLSGLAAIGLFDFVLLDFSYLKGINRRYVLAHEIGHACLLKHSVDDQNLMCGHLPAEGVAPVLTSEQVFKIRTSFRATYF